MSENWAVLTIEELIDNKTIIAHKDGNHGSNYPRAAEFGDEGVPFLTAKLLDDSGNIDLENSPRLSDEKADKFKFGFIETNDVLLSHNATVGRVAVVPEINERVLIGTSLTHYRLDETKLLPKYLAAYFSGVEFQNQLASVMSQTTRNQVPITSQRKLSVVVPPIEEQKRIADMLGCFDDKIKLNRQTNQTLEHIAQAIFKSWFVDFEPTRAKIAAKQAGQSPERAAIAAISGKPVDELDTFAKTNPEQYQQLKTTAALFSDALVDSELGEIPEGWEVSELGEILELAYGKALKKTDRIKGGYPVYGSGGLTGTHNKALVDGPGVVVGRKGTVGALYWEDSDFFPIDTVFFVKPKGKCSLQYIYYLLQTLGLEDMNTDAAVPGLNRNNAYRLEVIKAPEGLVASFSQLIGSVRSKLYIHKKESVCLEKIRDSLLPQLLSGEITIPSSEVA